MSHDPSISILDSAFSKKEWVHIKVNSPMKRALTEIAAQRGVSVGAILREAIIDNISRNYPNYVPLYERFKQEEMYGKDSLERESNK